MTGPIWLWLAVGVAGLIIQVPLLLASQEDLRLLRQLNTASTKLRLALARAHLRSNALRGLVIILDILLGIFLLLPLAREHRLAAGSALTTVLLFNEVTLVSNSVLDLQLRRKVRDGKLR